MTDGTEKRPVRGVYAIVDTTWVEPSDIAGVTAELLEGGVRIVQLRAKDLGGADLLRAARAMRRIASAHDTLFIVNDRVDVAVLSGADGVHLGLDDLPVEGARKLLGPGAVIGASTHNADEASSAEASGADYISLGPVFPTSTKKDAHSPRGLARLEEVRRATTLPIVAIGGINDANLAEVVKGGADSVAVISGLLRADDVRKKTMETIKAFAGASDR